jgi:hypothetical protein
MVLRVGRHDGGNESTMPGTETMVITLPRWGVGTAQPSSTRKVTIPLSRASIVGDPGRSCFRPRPYRRDRVP